MMAMEAQSLPSTPQPVAAMVVGLVTRMSILTRKNAELIDDLADVKRHSITLERTLRDVIEDLKSKCRNLEDTVEQLKETSSEIVVRNKILTCFSRV